MAAYHMNCNSHGKIPKTKHRDTGEASNTCYFEPKPQKKKTTYLVINHYKINLAIKNLNNQELLALMWDYISSE